MKLGLTHHNAFDFHLARQAYEKGFTLWQRARDAEGVAPQRAAPHALRVDWHHPPSWIQWRAGTSGQPA